MSDDKFIGIGRGQTFYGGNSVDSNYYGGQLIEGMQKVVQDANPATPRVLRSQQSVYLRLVRNTSGGVLLPKRAVTYAAGFYGTRVDGYCTTDFQLLAGIVDEFLPAAGVPNGDLFWIVEGGPTLWKSPLAGASFPILVAQGDALLALTAVTSGATTAGRFQKWNGTFTAAQTTDGTVGLINQNLFARAMSAMTTSQTNSDLLVDVIKKH